MNLDFLTDADSLLYLARKKFPKFREGEYNAEY